MRYDIDGVFVAQDGDLEINAELRLHDASVSVRKADGSPLSATATIPAVHPAAKRYVETVATELHRIAYRRSAPRAVPKPGGSKRRRTVEPVVCPECLGHRSFDCDLCEGAGLVAR